MKFSELQLNDQVLDALEAMRFDECTPIQEKSIPVILEGRDLIAVARKMLSTVLLCRLRVSWHSR